MSVCPKLPLAFTSLRISPLLSDQSQVTSVLANLSHELCRQLASLRAGFDLILGESPSPVAEDQREHLDDDGLAVRRLCFGFTRSSLDYAAVAQGSRPLCLGFYTIGALVNEIDRQFAPIGRLASNQVGISHHAAGVVGRDRRLTLPADLRKSRVERTEVHPGGRPGSHLRAGTRRFLAASRLLIPGREFPSILHERVFEPFVRLPRDERAGIEGSGLGLAICHELVMQLQGSVTRRISGERRDVDDRPLPDRGTRSRHT